MSLLKQFSMLPKGEELPHSGCCSSLAVPLPLALIAAWTAAAGAATLEEEAGGDFSFHAELVFQTETIDDFPIFFSKKPLKSHTSVVLLGVSHFRGDLPILRRYHHFGKVFLKAFCVGKETSCLTPL